MEIDPHIFHRKPDSRQKRCSVCGYYQSGGIHRKTAPNEEVRCRWLWKKRNGTLVEVGLREDFAAKQHDVTAHRRQLDREARRQAAQARRLFKQRSERVTSGIAKATRAIANGATHQEAARSANATVSAMRDWQRSYPDLWQAGYDAAMRNVAEVVRQQAGTDAVLIDLDNYLTKAARCERWVRDRGEELFPTGDEMTLSKFYENYKTLRLSDAAARTIETYDSTVQLWILVTGDPPLESITTELLASFRNCISKRRARQRRHNSISPNTVRKHLRHLQAILDRAGPPAQRCRDAVGILTHVPWVKPPREEHGEPQPANCADIVALYSAVDDARLPRVEGVAPAKWWRACISTICSTSLRIGQVTRIPMNAINWRESKIVLPASVSRKSLRQQTFPLHEFALRDLFAIRGTRELILSQPHSPTNLYKELRRLLRQAGVPSQRYFAFHGIRRAVLDELSKHSPTAAQKAAGHESYKTTLLHYIGTGALADAIEQSEIMKNLGEASRQGSSGSV